MQPYGQPGGGFEQMPPQPQRGGTDVAKVIAIILGVLGCLYVLGCIVMAAVLGTAVTVGLASCQAQFADAPAQDSPSDAAFISNVLVNDRDLTTFDALSGAIESVYESRTQQGSDEAPSLRQVLTVDQLRANLEAGSWPSDPEGYGDVESSLSPQLWVRLAELSQTHLEDETGESWEVLDFAYPFPNNGPVPWPAFISENSCTQTLLRCTSGEDEGLCVSVSYYRWADPVYYEYDIDAAREQRDARQEQFDALDRSGLLSGRIWALEAGDVIVWSTGDGDPLCDPDAFLAFARQVQETAGDSCRITLVPADLPISIVYYPIAYDYPNDRPAETMGIDEARKVLIDTGSRFQLESTWSDALLTVRIDPDSEVEPILDGSLAPEPEPVVIEGEIAGHTPKGAEKL